MAHENSLLSFERIVCLALGLFVPNSLSFVGFALIRPFAYLLDPEKTAKITTAE